MNETKRAEINTDKDTVILYHANCLDGFGAAYAAWKHFGDNAEYIPVKYGEPAPVINDKRIYIVDFSYKTDELNWLANRDNKITVIDHHKSALPEIQASGIFSYAWQLEKSGAVLIWEYFHPGIPVPEMLLHIQDRDLWKFELEGTKEICAALYSTGNVIPSFESWDNMIENWDDLFKTILGSMGTILIADMEAKINNLADHAFNCSIKEITGVNGLAINAPEVMASELGNELAKRSGTYGAIWTYIGAGKYKVSLRSIGDFDVSEIAKAYGGGGHKNAAGFIVDSSKGEILGLILRDLSYEY